MDNVHTDVLVDILTYLSVDSLLKCQKVSNEWNGVILKTASLRYKLMLGMSGYAEAADGGPATTAARLNLFNAFYHKVQTAWMNPSIGHVQLSIPLFVEEWDGNFSFQDGLFIRSMLEPGSFKMSRLQVNWLQSSLVDPEHRISTLDFKTPVAMYKHDASQNLLLCCYFEVADLDNNLCRLHVEPLTLTDGNPHHLAQAGSRFTFEYIQPRMPFAKTPYPIITGSFAVLEGLCPETALKMTSVYHWPSGKRLIQFIDTPSTTHPSVLPLHDHLLVIRINEKCVVLDVYKLQERNSGSDGPLATFGFPPIRRNAFVVESVLIPPCTSSYNILNPSQRHPLFYMEPVLVGVLIQVEFLFYIFTVPTAIFQPGQFIPEYSPRSPIESKIIPWTAWGERYTCLRTATNRLMPMRIFGYNVFTEDEIFNFNPYSHHSLMRHYFQSSVAEYVTLTQALTGDDGRGGFTCDIVSRFPHWKVPLNRPEAVTEATSCEPFESGDGPMLLCISDSEFAAEVYSLG